MTEREYDAIQYDLSKLLKKVRRGCSRAYGGREEAYEEGVLACKSAISRYNPNPKHREASMWAKQLETNPWIPITERLPEEPLNSVIGWDTSRNRCCFVQYINGQWKLGNWDPVDIVAWMPLPKPYEED